MKKSLFFIFAVVTTLVGKTMFYLQLVLLFPFLFFVFVFVQKWVPSFPFLGASFFCRVFVWNLRIFSAIHVRIQQEAPLPNTPYMVVSNHQSMLETFVLSWLFSPLCPVLKKELLEIPLFGSVLRNIKPIPIERSARLQALKSMRLGIAQRIESGKNVLIFPEGTRKPPHSPIKYARSAADIAWELQIPVVPVAHNSGLYWRNKKILNVPGIVDVCIGAPIFAQDCTSSEELHLRITAWTQNTLVALSHPQTNIPK